MLLKKRYQPDLAEAELRVKWDREGTYKFDPDRTAPIYSIDTPPPTVSGRLHLGHCYSYSHPDFMARFWRMNGYNIFYPMGFDDNGLPTGRLVEHNLDIRARDMEKDDFIQKCLQISEEVEGEYKEIWKRLGLSIDWNYTYRTISEKTVRISQLSFIRLYQQGMVYRKESPTIWCPECGTAIAQAELNDLQRTNEFVTLRFKFLSTRQEKDENISSLFIATTRPELLPACVAIFIHPGDDRYSHLVGGKAEVPIFLQHVPIIADELVDPEKGTGIVMCCTFGDQTDVTWWQEYHLPMVQAIETDGRMNEQAGVFAGLTSAEARKKIKNKLIEDGILTKLAPISQSIRVHERCDTPVEYISNHQWFIRILDHKGALLAAGDKVNWYPNHMANRYKSWVENLKWDWCISRQRYFGVSFPVWHCSDCGEIIIADEEQLPVDPSRDKPDQTCNHCGGTSFRPETDVMDTWATSSLTPQIVAGWLENPDLYKKVFPFTLRPQAHEIIRTWAFYTIAKSTFHFNSTPWRDVFISGWGIAGQGEGKISKSRGGGPMTPMEMMDKYSADAVRYWAASTGPGKDAIISEDKIQTGEKLVNKIWNVARFSHRFIEGYHPTKSYHHMDLSPADRWILSETQELIQRVTSQFRNYDYAAAKAEVETFFWMFADNYLEMAKQRLYDPDSDNHEGAKFTLYLVLLTLIKLFAPILPFITDTIYQEIFKYSQFDQSDSVVPSIHQSQWPIPIKNWIDHEARTVGEYILEIATQIRRYKSEHNLSLGTMLPRVKLSLRPGMESKIQLAIPDLRSITRVNDFDISEDGNQSTLSTSGKWDIVVEIPSHEIHPDEINP